MKCSDAAAPAPGKAAAKGHRIEQTAEPDGLLHSGARNCVQKNGIRTEAIGARCWMNTDFHGLRLPHRAWEVKTIHTGGCGI